jgi:hypothetical protein
MDTLSKTITGYVAAAVLGAGLLLAVAYESTRLHALEKTSAQAQEKHPSTMHFDNWGDERNRTLLKKAETARIGIDVETFGSANLFALLPEETEPVLDPKLEPEPEPKVEKKPPPPTTRQISLVYLGRYTTSQGKVMAYFNIDGSIRIFNKDAIVAGDWAVEKATANALTLRNQAGDERIFSFNKEKMLEVPLVQP